MNYAVGCLMLTGLLTGCSSWPDANPGGGEPMAIIAEPVYLSALKQSEQAGLLAQSEVLDANTELMILQGAIYCIPASILQLQQQGLRVRRQLAAGLLVDAATDLAAYQHQIRQVRWRFERVRQQTQCTQIQPEAVSEKAAMGQQVSLFTILFDTDSAQIGPGYTHHFAVVAEALKQCNCQVVLRGHTDRSGAESANQQLAERRVSAVQQALQQLGVQVTTQLAVGEQEPLLQGAEEELMNRRVEVLILPVPQEKTTEHRPQQLLLRQWHDVGVSQVN